MFKFIYIIVFLTSIYLFSESNENLKKIELISDIEDILKNKDLNNSNFGIKIYNLDSNSVIYENNSEKNLIPASTNKIICTFSAIKILDTNFRYSTQLYIDGDLNEKGDFLGDLYIRGLGDPTNSYSFKENPYLIFESFFKSLDSLGIKTIKGNLIVDDRYFDKQYYGNGWMWDDFVYPFSAQISALSFLDNQVQFSIKNSIKLNEKPDVISIPNSKYFRYYNLLETKSNQNSPIVNIYRDFKSNDIYIYGTIPIDSVIHNPILISSTIDNPPLYFSYLFKNYLESKDLNIKGAILDAAELDIEFKYTDLKLINNFQSEKIISIISNINKLSNNFAADILLKTIGKEKTGEGSFSNGISSVKNFYKSNTLDFEKFSYIDGSGLSRYNLISPDQQIEILRIIYKDKFNNIFINSLAQPGKIGTLKNRLINTKAENRVYAKTGTMSNVSNITGFVIDDDNDMLAFSLMFNGFTAPISSIQSIQDLILMRLAAYTRK